MRRSRRGRLSGAGLLSLLTVIGLGVAGPLASAPHASASTPAVCGPSAPPASVYYGTTVTSTGIPMISSVTVNHLPSACQGGRAHVELFGNSAGDSSVPTSEDTVLASVESTVDPCTGGTRAHPVLISNDEITMSFCPTASADSDLVDIGKLTAVSLTVNGIAVKTSLGHAATSLRPSSSGALAFTGLDEALLVAAGVLAVLVGMGLVLLVRARRVRPTAQP